MIPSYLLLAVAAAVGTGVVSSRFISSEAPSSIVYPVRVDKFGRTVGHTFNTARTPSSTEEERHPRHWEDTGSSSSSGGSRNSNRERSKGTTSSSIVNSRKSPETRRFKRQTFIEDVYSDTGNSVHDFPRQEHVTVSNEDTWRGEHQRNHQVNTQTNSDQDDIASVDDGEMFVRIENADEDLFLQLRPNRNLRTRGTVIEWVLPGGATILKAAPDDCFMVGRSVGEEENSLVAVSSCSGITGLIQTSRNSYFIEPLSSQSNSDHSRSNAADGSSGAGSPGDNDDFIQQHWNRSRYEKERDYRRLLEEKYVVEHDSGNRAYQHQRGYQEILSLPEPHVIYKVNTILERLNISLHEDQKYHWENSGSNNVGNRQKRSTKLDRDRAQKGRAPQSRTNKKNRRKGSKKDRKSDDITSTRKKRRRRRNRRHNRRNRERRQRCRELEELSAGISDVGDGVANASNTSGGVLQDGVSNILPPTEEELLQCAHEQERRTKRREERNRRRQERELKLKAREEKRRARAERRRQRGQKKTKRKGRKLNADVGNSSNSSSSSSSSSSSPRTPWSMFNLTGSEWNGGYSPDLPWEVAQPAHSPSVVEEHLSPEGGPVDNRTAPQRWLEVTVAVDSSVIDFHGENNTEQYIFTLFNIVSAIYQDPSLGAKLDLVLLRLICYTDPKQSQVRAGEAKSSLEAVNRWASRLHHASQPPLRHDMAVWLTRHPLGGPSGYAPVGGVCHPSRSCTLNRDEGLTSAFIIAHEMGHVLGLSHDGDRGSSNDCVSEGVLGSVMAPLVAATFTSFHWSRCSRTEYLDHVNSWECMTSPPSWLNATTVSPVVSYHYSLDDQCRMEFGEGFGLCRSFGLSDSCSHLWCANISSPHLCKTKKGPPLEGTVCGEGKWCRFGVCTSRGSAYHPVDGTDAPNGGRSPSPRNGGSSPVRHNPQNGGWSQWSEWGPCSVTCGPGVSFRTRACDNPRPLWGGRRCRGKKEEWRVCGGEACEVASDVRAAHCSNLASIVELDLRRSALNWLPYEPKSKRHKCRVSCYSRATNEMFLGNESLRDGAPCSYDAPHHHICVQGKCVELGCDLVAGSRKGEDECGVCGGDGGSCSTHTETYFDTPRQEYTVVTVIPKGARQISVKEQEATTNFLALADRGYLTSSRKQSGAAGGHGSHNWSTVATSSSTERLIPREAEDDLERTFTEEDSEGFMLPGYPLAEEAILLNPASRQGPARSFVSEGAQFHYKQLGERETITARGPLLYDVAILIHGGSVESPVHVTSSYSLLEPPDPHKWEGGPLGPCTTSCGGGEQQPVLICRNPRTGLEEEHSHCSHLPVPQLQTVPCNTFSCNVAWRPGPWEHCSATCGVSGLQHRVVSCISVHEPDVAIDPQYCPQDTQPDDARPCNREACPAYWEVAGWTKCNREGPGNIGRQMAMWRCPPLGLANDVTYDCGLPPGPHHRSCTVPCEGSHGDTTRTESASDDSSRNEVTSLPDRGCRRKPVSSPNPALNEIFTSRIETRTRKVIFGQPHSSSTNKLSTILNRRTFHQNHTTTNSASSYPPSPDVSENISTVIPPGEGEDGRFPSPACSKDASKLCRLPALRQYCQLPGYRKLCCLTCAAAVNNSE